MSCLKIEENWPTSALFLALPLIVRHFQQSPIRREFLGMDIGTPASAEDCVNQGIGRNAE